MRSAQDKTKIHFIVEMIVERDQGGYHVYCPALKGLHAGGDTEEEALLHARDAAIAYLRSLIKHGDPIPVGVALEEMEGEQPPHSGDISAHKHVHRLAVTTA